MELVLQMDLRDIDVVQAVLYFPESTERQKEYVLSREKRVEAARVAWLVQQEIDHIRSSPRVEHNTDIPLAFALQDSTDSLIGYVEKLLPAVGKAIGAKRASELLVGVEQNLKEALIAGEVFCNVYGMALVGVAEPSKSKAQWLVSQERKLSESQIKNYWRKYKDIIHLCAAYFAHYDQLTEVFSNPLDIYAQGRTLLSVVTLSRAFWEWGTCYYDRNGAPLLLQNGWEPPVDYSLPLPFREKETGKVLIENVSMKLDEPYMSFGYSFENKLKKYRKK